MLARMFLSVRYILPLFLTTVLILLVRMGQQLIVVEEKSNYHNSLLRSLKQHDGSITEVSGVADSIETQIKKQIPNQADCPRWFDLATVLQRCFIYELRRTPNDKLWSKLSHICDICGAHLLKVLLRTKFLRNYDDIKAVILPQYTEDGGNVLVTIGVGKDIRAEMTLRSLLSRTQFFGVDPIKESGGMYGLIGKYYPLAISDTAGLSNLSVMVNNSYVWKEIETITLVDLLQRRLPLNGKPVDYLFMDIEGEEYRLLPKIAGLNYTLCQINVEVHGPLEKYGSGNRKLSQLLHQLISSTSRYLPIWIPAPTSHHRFFLIDYRSPYCVQKFYRHWC